MNRRKIRIRKAARLVENLFVYGIFAPLCIAAAIGALVAVAATFFYGLYLAIILAPL